MTPSMADEILHRFESGHPMSQDRGTPIPGFDVPKHSNNLLHAMRVSADDERQRQQKQQDMSQARANMAAMNNDAISAGLWALASFDPALVHLAELRERFTHLDEGDQIRVTLDRLTGVYVEGQCRELLHGAAITTHEADQLIATRIGDTSDVALHVLACTNDPLAMEIFAYGLYLGSLTAHGNAPWNRFAATMADCYHHRHPSLVK